MRLFFSVIIMLFANNLRAEEIPLNCRAVINVLELNEGNLHSVDREVVNFSTIYAPGETVQNGVMLRGRIFTATTTCLALRFKDDGTPVVSPGVILQIAEPSDSYLGEQAEAWSTMRGHFAYVNKIEKDSPDRVTIWAARCSWEKDTDYECKPQTLDRAVSP